MVHIFTLTCFFIYIYIFLGMDPNWRHIIPPLQEKVISEGHCIEDCTRRAFPKTGISIFAVMMRTHQIGKEIKLRHVRMNEEFAPIALDRNVDPNYQEFRRLPNAVRTMPGDRLISECTYDSSSRDQITLGKCLSFSFLKITDLLKNFIRMTIYQIFLSLFAGGLTTREESCVVLTYYYPRQKRLTTCHSLPSLPTVLHSLGIEELAVWVIPKLFWVHLNYTLDNKKLAQFDCRVKKETIKLTLTYRFFFVLFSAVVRIQYWLHRHLNWPAWHWNHD